MDRQTKWKSKRGLAGVDYSHCSALDDLADLVEVLSKLFHRRAQHLNFLVSPFSTEERPNLTLTLLDLCQGAF